MGGVAGHMSHIYENPNLSFSQIKEIFFKASSGELKGTEKTDGQNIFLSFSVAENEGRAARNKGDIKKGGMSREELSEKFSGRDSLQSAFNGAFNVWEQTIKKLPTEVQVKIFGKDADVWFNAEVQDPGTANVINYDSKNLVIHQAGHALYDKKSGQAKDVDVTKKVSLLNNSIINTTSSQEESGDWKIVNNAILNLRALDNDKALKEATSRIDSLLSKFSLSDNNTIGDFINLRLKQIIDEKIPGLPDDVTSNLISKITGAKGLNINKITKLLTPVQSERVKLLANNSSEVLKKIISPLESIVHDFSVEMLQGLESIFILDNKKETDRIRSEVEQAIRVIQNSTEEEAIKILNNQLKKLKSVENISTAVEGFVFSYDGMVYKFTGNFAPINQILGLFRFGRGKIPPLKHLVKESSKNRIIALVPGGYKPPHAGHYMQAKYFSNIDTVDEVLVLISPKSRFNSSKELEITSKQSEAVWNIFLQNDSKIKAVIADSSSPVKAVFDFLEKNTNPGDKVLLGVSEKEAEESSGRYRNIEKFVTSKGLNIEVEVIETPAIQIKSKNISATDLREMIANGDKENFISYLPNHLNKIDKQKVWNIMSSENINELKNTEEKEYSLDEISTMAGGAVHGSTPNLNKGTLPKKKFTYKEDNFMKREDLVKELTLREAIRDCIDKIYSNMIKKRINEEIQVREFIKKAILKEFQDVEEVPHDSTGINVLEELLKKIIPVIEQGYKTLTTKKEQRDSYRAHILNAIQKSITQMDITKRAGAIDIMAEDVHSNIDNPVIDDDIDISVGNDPAKDEKFIDIDNKKKDDKDDQKEDFTIKGEDPTGRDMAQKTWEKVEGSVLDSYSILNDPTDQKLFYDYLLANVKLYFDKFESELSPSLGEPHAGDKAAEENGTVDELDDDIDEF